MYCSTSNYYDILVDQGATLNRAFFLKSSTKSPISLTGYIARMHIRESISDSTIVETLTSGAGDIVITAATGRVDILIRPADTAAMTPKTYAYDLELESSTGEVTKILAGKLTVRAETTY